MHLKLDNTPNKSGTYLTANFNQSQNRIEVEEVYFSVEDLNVTVKKEGRNGLDGYIVSDFDFWSDMQSL